MICCLTVLKQIKRKKSPDNIHVKSFFLTLGLKSKLLTTGKGLDLQLAKLDNILIYYHTFNIRKRITKDN